mmetsp:Transcript_44691/g.68372  ORF Transcript_44691/g.68372 Transcript_44691/m.68372 type:complete len:447 (+) Transcript_44691:2-1342(+)
MKPTRELESLQPVSRISSVSNVDDLRLLCENEFKRTSMVNRADELPKFKYEEIVQGKFLGKGGFATVYEVRGFDLFRSSRHSHFSTGMADASDLSDHDDEDDKVFDAFVVRNREFLSRHCIRHGGGEARFAVKRLRADVRGNHDKKLSGMADIARECHFLGMIDHPNIVRLRAVSLDSKFDDGYFIIIDRLYDTLTKRLETWRKQKKSVSGVMKHLRDRKGVRRAKLGEDVTMAQFELASALSYLHSKKIIYRDLKSDNIGFDIRGDLRLFDLGLAKELQPEDSVGDDGLYLLTECCGTPRYMASEVATGKPYNEACDVYSFGLLCWQMASLKLPYEKYTLSRLQGEVWSAPYNRPPINKKWPEFFKRLLCESWNHSVKHRPTMKEIEQILAKEVGKHKKEFDLRSHLMKRRSSMVLHKVESMRIAGGKNVSTGHDLHVSNPHIQQ